MKYIAISQPTSAWLLSNKECLRALLETLPSLISDVSLRETVLAAASFRAAGSKDGTILALWNTDYMSSTGEEAWGFIRIAPPLDLLAQPEISEEVLERTLYVISQRLQGLLLSQPNVIHRAWPNGAHTCTAGRGELAWRQSIGYFEREVSYGTTSIKTLVSAGPSHDFTELSLAAERFSQELPQLLVAANDIALQSSLRPLADSRPFCSLRERLTSSARPTPETESFLETSQALDSDHQYEDAYRTTEWTYEQWLSDESPLTAEQRRIISSDALLSQPMRIIGAAGSGKTLLMMLMALRQLVRAEKENRPCRVLYVTHNSAMMDSAWSRFITLGAERFLEGTPRRLDVRTLLEHSVQELQLDAKSIIATDAQETKEYQRREVTTAFDSISQKRAAEISKTKTLSQATANESLRTALIDLIASEIGIAIKGHGLANDRKRYVESERRLSRLHGMLDPLERDIVYDCFEFYHRAIFEGLEVFDSDDLAISLLGRLRTPIWEMKRRKLGHDFVFVDEAQLFNENEKRIFSLLTKPTAGHVPVVLALDEAQHMRGATSSGLGLLGIPGIADENLRTVHRSTAAILKIAFFAIQRTTDLFGFDFPDFTKSTTTLVPDTHELALPPRIVRASDSSQGLGKFVLKRVRELRKENIRHIAVVCHAEKFWSETARCLSESNLPFRILTQRGERFDPKKPIVVLSRPETIGGQEFDAVIALGLEQGLVPPRVEGNESLGVALEQQALREMYLSFTRARYRLVIANSFGSSPSPLIADAIRAGLLTED